MTAPPRFPADRRALLARLAVPPGLCAACAHLRFADSGRSVFARCGLADSDPRFLRYPPLPVAECGGYEKQPADPSLSS